MSKGFTIFLGVAEVAGALGVAFGVLTQLAAPKLILIMMGAIQKKIFRWHTRFWGEKTYGWHYDLMLVVMNLVILFTDGGRWVRTKSARQNLQKLDSLVPTTPVILGNRVFRRTPGALPRVQT